MVYNFINFSKIVFRLCFRVNSVFLVDNDCFFIVFQFWKISDQIGRENSFSEENAVSFHRMTISSIIIVIQYIIRIILFIALDKVNIMSLYLRGGMAIAFILFAVLTEALAGLVRNAYEMKQEADLTI